jgi:hypothetical protein
LLSGGAGWKSSGGSSFAGKDVPIFEQDISFFLFVVFSAASLGVEFASGGLFNPDSFQQRIYENISADPVQSGLPSYGLIRRSSFFAFRIRPCWASLSVDIKTESVQNK